MTDTSISDYSTRIDDNIYATTKEVLVLLKAHQLLATKTVVPTNDQQLCFVDDVLKIIGDIDLILHWYRSILKEYATFNHAALDLGSHLAVKTIHLTYNNLLLCVNGYTDSEFAKKLIA